VYKFGNARARRIERIGGPAVELVGGDDLDADERALLRRTLLGGREVGGDPGRVDMRDALGEVRVSMTASSGTCRSGSASSSTSWPTISRALQPGTRTVRPVADRYERRLLFSVKMGTAGAGVSPRLWGCKRRSCYGDNAMKRIPIFLLLISFALPAAASDLVQEFSGTGNKTTASFDVEAPWLLDWRVNGDYEQMIALDVMLVDAESGRLVGRVAYTKRPGDGLRLFKQGGRYKLRISSTLARWDILIRQLTDEEAKQYTSREQGKPATSFGN
jgi:hypothetical protein